LDTEKIIHIIIFFLFLVGACWLAIYALSVAIPLTSPVFFAGTAIVWGVILLVLYLVFKKQNWEWWR